MKRGPKSAARVVVLENSGPISDETEAIQNRIRQRAFEISLTRPQDAHEIYDWIMAESQTISVPPLELVEKEGTFELRFGVAAVNPDDVNVMVTPNHILLKSEYSHQHDSGIGTVHICDFKSATVFRSVSLPERVDVNSVKVDFQDGMIVVTAVKQGAEQEIAKPTAPVRKALPKKSRSRMP